MKVKILLLLFMVVFIIMATLFIFTDFFKDNQKIKISDSYILLKTDDFDSYSLMSSKYGGYNLILSNVCQVYKRDNKLMITTEDISPSITDSLTLIKNSKDYYIISNDSVIQINEKELHQNKKSFVLNFTSPFCK